MRKENISNEESDSVSSDSIDRISIGISEEEEEGEDLFGNGYHKDYAENPLLDRYEEEDEETVEELTPKEREAAEREIANTYPSLRHSSQGHWDSSESETASVSQQEEQDPLDDFTSIKNHINTQVILDRIKKELIGFLRTYGNRKYIEQINQMASLNMQSIYVDYFDLEKFSSTIAQCVLVFPNTLLPILNQALSVVVQSIFPRYSQIKHVLLLRITNVPTFDQIRNLRNCHLNTLVKIIGIITKRSSVYPKLFLAKYVCQKCKAILGPFLIENEFLKPNRCIECQSIGPFEINSEETIYKDYQKVTIQEVPGTIPPGRLPRSKELILQYDLIDYVKPGDEVEVVGTYKNNFTNSLNIKNGVPIFYTSIEVLSMAKRGDDFSIFSITEEDEKKIIALSKKQNILSFIIASIAPSIHGHFVEKRAIALSIFGGVPKATATHNIRGDINTLLLGDPGMAKSQLLKYIEKISHRAVFATGQGASAVGLTAMVKKDPVTREWTLEGGALVLADRGVCLIDEFDKMKDTDRVSIHEAMEQQSISISKAGIVTSLQARCSIIAAANPIRGRYNSAYTFAQNVNLPDPIISRFDIICILKDECSPKSDRELASFIVKSHASRNLASQDNLIPQELLRKYVAYAREKIHPKSTTLDKERISSLYASLRKESKIAGGIPITVRHIESIVRISEASARIHLRETVIRSDIDLAIEVALDSFCGTQKLAVKRALLKKLSKYLPSSDQDFPLLSSLLNKTFEEVAINLQNTGNSAIGYSVPCKEFKKKASSLGMNYTSYFNSKEFQKHFILSSCGSLIQRKE
ncbi:DNA replication licensing factor MCM2 [Nematocida sp. LUAm3]|nr:DNA replication licensing factor MCM2 [Nematocida sp. LUAm3]KAI5174062.1 DNA replication licensing factor MCM2 [Nematocida sp. LUAm2]KAI5177195.1 DNA replication licensing factor MCM2 [Nematocida sp. LUAm1]